MPIWIPLFLRKTCNSGDIAHSTVHTKNYYLAVWKRLEKTNDPISVRHALQQIAKELSDGSFPY